MDRLVIGCGYLGQRLLADWGSSPHRLWTTTRKPERSVPLQSQGAMPLVCDVTKPETLTILPRVNTVLYCVGLDPTSPPSMREVYVQGLANVLAHLPKPDRFLYVSSTSVYGQNQGEWVDESAVTEPVEESGRIVLEAEQLLRQRWPEAIILRFAGIYGPGRLLRQPALMAGEPLATDPESWLNLIHVVDGARLVAAAETQARPGEIYNVCDDCPVRRREFFSLLAHLLKAQPPRFVPGLTAKANRRVANRRLHDEWHFQLQYPGFDQGLPASLF